MVTTLSWGKRNKIYFIPTIANYDLGLGHKQKLYGGRPKVGIAKSARTVSTAGYQEDKRSPRIHREENAWCLLSSFMMAHCRYFRTPDRVLQSHLGVWLP